MHLLNAFSVTENYDTEGFHNIIANVFEVVLEYATVLPTHALYQLKPNILLGVDIIVQYQVGILVVVKSIFLIPSPQSLCK